MNRLFLSLSLLTGLLLGCQQVNDPADAQPKTISDVLIETSSFSLLRAAVLQAGLSDALKGAQLTLFAPTDDAFRAAGYATPESFRNVPVEQLRALLRYHLINGTVTTQTPELASAANLAVESSGQRTLFVTNGASGLFVNGSRATQTDRVVANGIIHSIGKVLSPAATDVVSALAQRSDLSLLRAAVARAATLRPELLQILNGTTTNANLRQLTVFAPNDAAFQAAGFRTVADINNASATTLGNILTYHVVPGLLFSNQLQTGQLTTLNATSSNRIAVTVAGSVATVKGNRNPTVATIREADIVSGNAVIHVIDQVLQP